MGSFKSITVHEVNALLDKEQVAIVDIRDAASYDQAHIRGAVLLDDSNVEDFLNKTDKAVTVICYCYHGMSSQSAADFFVQKGFVEVYSLIGGFEEWRQNY